MVLFMIENTACRYAAIGVFILASITDAVDGHIARKYNQTTTFGKFVDPLADKVLTTAAFLILMHYGRMSVWALMIVITREFMVAGIRLVAAGEGNVVAASMWGKLKTVTQMVAVIVAMLLLQFDKFLGVPAGLISDILIWISVVFTVISGVDYLVKNWNLMEMK
jgi:CDP-diacylglycerol--glycerol-3-phosphate 3-phosphatidyltransferase